MSDNTYSDGLYFKGDNDVPSDVPDDVVLLSFEKDEESLSLKNQHRLKVVARKSGGVESVLFVIEPDGSLTLATNISKKLGLNLVAGGQLKVNFDREF